MKYGTHHRRRASVSLLSVAVGMSLGGRGPRTGRRWWTRWRRGTRRGAADVDDAAPGGHAAAGRHVHEQELLPGRKYWLDKRYTRCNTPRQLTDMGPRPPFGAWGDCNLDQVDEDRQPATVQDRAEHYEALLAEAKKAGGPTVHTRQTMPDWDGWYRRLAREEQWIWGRNLQTATMLSLLTPEYQRRMVQQNYHEAVNNSPQWMASFCYPEGFMRWWAQASHGGPIELMVTPHQVQFLSGIADNLLRRVLIGTQARAEGAAVVSARPSASGTATRWSPGPPTCRAGRCRIRCSSSATSCRRSSRSRPSADGKTITVEATFYDPEAFTRPLHTVTPWERAAASTIPRRASRSWNAACRAPSSTVLTAGRRS